MSKLNVVVSAADKAVVAIVVAAAFVVTAAIVYLYRDDVIREYKYRSVLPYMS